MFVMMELADDVDTNHVMISDQNSDNQRVDHREPNERTEWSMDRIKNVCFHITHFC